MAQFRNEILLDNDGLEQTIQTLASFPRNCGSKIENGAPSKKTAARQPGKNAKIHAQHTHGPLADPDRVDAHSSPGFIRKQAPTTAAKVEGSKRKSRVAPLGEPQWELHARESDAAHTTHTQGREKQACQRHTRHSSKDEEKHTDRKIFEAGKNMSSCA